MLWKFNSAYDPALQLADHAQPVRYELPVPLPHTDGAIDKHALYIHRPAGRRARAIDDTTENFVDATRMGTA